MGDESHCLDRELETLGDFLKLATNYPIAIEVRLLFSQLYFG
jgi:hypothetical protein